MYAVLKVIGTVYKRQIGECSTLQSPVMKYLALSWCLGVEEHVTFTPVDQ